MALFRIKQERSIREGSAPVGVTKPFHNGQPFRAGGLKLERDLTMINPLAKEVLSLGEPLAGRCQGLNFGLGFDAEEHFWRGSDWKGTRLAGVRSRVKGHGIKVAGLGQGNSMMVAKIDCAIVGCNGLPPVVNLFLMTRALECPIEKGDQRR